MPISLSPTLSTPPPRPCSGPLSRRGFMRVGLSGFAGLSLPGLLKLRADESNTKPNRAKTAVILVWMRGGCSHLDTYDPKPDSGSEYRGPFSTLASKVPGMTLTELIPKQASIADKFTLLRSMTHTGGGHPAGSLQMLGGDSDAADKLKPVLPDWMCVANYLRSREKRTNPLPNYIGVNPIVNYDNFTIAGPSYTGVGYSPLAVLGDPNKPDFEVPNVGISDPEKIGRLNERVALRRSLDRLERSMDTAGEMGALDQFEAQAMTLLTNSKTRDAFDLSREDTRTRDRYGRNRWGQQLLMARRLVESGVEIITSCLDGPQCGRVQNWDDHAVNHNVFEALKFRMGAVDQAVSALIEDVYARGLDNRVLVVVSGEFGRTPKISYERSTGAGDASAAAGVMQPGRDHWPRAFTNLWAGGGIQTGGIIGSSDKRGEDVKDRHCGPGDFLATIYHHLGINAETTTLNDFAGRPTPLVADGKPIKELIGA